MRNDVDPGRTGEWIKIDNDYYHLGSVLNEGINTTVYCATKIGRNNELFAIKRVRTSNFNDAQMESLMNQGEIARLIQDAKHIIQTYCCTYKVDEKCAYIVMEKANASLHAHLAPYLGAMTTRMVVRYWLAMLKAVDELHSRGIVHADLKLSNFVRVNDTIKLIDFGIAYVAKIGRSKLARNYIMGTVDYMSPESLNTENSGANETEETRKKSDVWSLGILLYQLAFGKVPFHHLETLHEITQAVCDPKVNIPFPPCDDELLLDALKKCLERQPHLRPSTEKLLKHPLVTQYLDETNESREDNATALALGQ